MKMPNPIAIRCQADILDSVDHGFGSHLCHDLT